MTWFEVDVLAVAEAGEGFEAGHPASSHGRAPDPASAGARRCPPRLPTRGLVLRPRRRGVAGRRPIPGAADAIAPAAGGGRAGACSSPTTPRPRSADQEATLAAAGVPADGRRHHLGPGRRPRCWRRGRPALRLRRARRGRRRWPRGGSTTVTTGDADAVVVGFTIDFDYERLRPAHRAVLAGGPAHRHQRRPDLPDARRADPGRRRAAGRGGHGRRGDARRWRASRTGPWPTWPGPWSGRATTRWWATARPPTAASPASSGPGSPWC